MSSCLCYTEFKEKIIKRNFHDACTQTHLIKENIENTKRTPQVIECYEVVIECKH